MGVTLVTFVFISSFCYSFQVKIFCNYKQHFQFRKVIRDVNVPEYLVGRLNVSLSFVLGFFVMLRSRTGAGKEQDYEQWKEHKIDYVRQV